MTDLLGKEEGPKQQSRRKGAHALRRRALMAPAKNLDEAIDRAAGLVKEKEPGKWRSPRSG